jgi:hypothetical protein
LFTEVSLKVEWRISHNFGDLDIHLHRVMRPADCREAVKVALSPRSG